MRRGEDDDIDLVAGGAIGGHKGVELGAADANRVGDRTGELDGLRRDPRHMEQRGRTIARHRRAEMLERIGAGGVLDALDQRHLPVGAAVAADHAAQRAPFRQIVQANIELKAAGCAAVRV